MEDHPARIHNARLEPIEFGKQGFTLVKHATDVDFANTEDVQRRYHPEVCRHRQGAHRRHARCSPSWASCAAATRTWAADRR